MKKTVKWLLLLIKRQFRQPTFLLLLVLIPAIVFGYTAISQGQSGAITVALSWQEGDELAEALCQKLQTESQLIRFIPCGTNMAEDMVHSGKADAAWIFSEDTEAALQRFVEGSYEPFILVVEREQTTSLLLAREKLTAAVFAAGSEMFYEHYLRQQVPGLETVSRETLMEYYHSTMMAGSLFQFEDISGNLERLEDQEQYLLSPLRGLLATVAAVCAMACAMYYCRDNEKGVFVWVAEGIRPVIELISQLICLLSVLCVSMLSLAIAGLSAEIWKEMLLIAVYGLCCAGFGMLLRQLLRSPKAIATALPLLSIAMLAVCPVFFEMPGMRLPSLLFPPTYFINGVYNTAYLIGGLAYSAICLSLCWVTNRLRTK